VVSRGDKHSLDAAKILSVLEMASRRRHQ